MSDAGSLKEHVRELNPAYFAMVMATGIVAVACAFLGYDTLARVLGAVNYAFGGVLYVLYLWRVLAFPDAISKDLKDPRRTVGFLTLAAGTCILGNQSILVFGSSLAAAIFLSRSC